MLNHSSNVTYDYNDETNFPHKLLLTNTQVSRILDGGRNFCNGKVILVIITNIYNHLQHINSNYNQNY